MSKYRKAVRFSTETASEIDTQEQKTVLAISDRPSSEAQNPIGGEERHTVLHSHRPKTANAKKSSRFYDNDVKLEQIESSFAGNKVIQTQTLNDRSSDFKQLEKAVDRPKTRRKLSLVEDSEPRKAYSPYVPENKSFQRRAYRPLSQVGGISVLPRYLSRTMSASQPVITGIGLKSTEIIGSGSNDPLKSDLQEINYRLSHYIQHVRDLRLAPLGNGAENTVQLHHSLSTLEQEIRNLKQIYETELESMRQKYSEASQEKTRHDLEVRRLKSLLRDCEQRLTLESESRQKAASQVELLQKTVVQREQELRDAEEHVRQPLDELAEVQRNASSWWNQLQDMTKSCDNERLKRQEADDKVLQLQKKLEFGEKIHEQEKADQNRRMQDMARVIVALEQKVEELSKPDTSVADMVAQAQLMAESDIRQFQQDTEKYFTRSLTEMKGQLDEQLQHSKVLSEDIERLKAENATLTSKLRTIAAELALANTARLSAEDLLRREQSLAQSSLQTMERRLRDLQDLLVVKMREAVSARDAQGLLKTEIDTLRTMLGDEERRLRLSSSCCAAAKVNGAASRSESVSVLPILSSAAGTANDKLLPARVISAATVGGPTRTRSAAAAPDVNSKSALVPTSLGRGKEYFDEMYKDVQAKPTVSSSPSADTTKQSVNSKSSGHATNNMYTSSAIGDLKVLEVSKEGHFIRLMNASTQRCEEFGGYVLQQNVMGKMACNYRFPPYTKFPANSVITVWANDSKEYANTTNSAAEFVCTDIGKWGCSPEFTTILCKPNGQAIAWMTASNPYKALHGSPAAASVQKVTDDLISSDETREWQDQTTVSESLPVSRSSPAAPVYPRTDSLLLENSDTDQYAFYSLQPNDSLPFVPNSDQTSSVSPSSKSSPIPGAPYAGAPAQRMGSSKLRQYTLQNTQSPTTLSRGVLVKKPSGIIRFAPESSFVSPMQQQFSASSSRMGRTGLLA